MGSSGRGRALESAVGPRPLGRVVRTLRENQGISRQELAEKSGISAPMIAKIEEGQRRPSKEGLSRLAEVFGLAEQVLLDGADSPAFSWSIGVDVDPFGEMPAALEDKLAPLLAQRRKQWGNARIDPAAGSGGLLLAVGARLSRYDAMEQLHSDLGELTDPQLLAIAQLVRTIVDGQPPADS